MKGYVILITSVAALGGLLFGFDTAVIAGTLQYITKYFALSDFQLGLVGSATSIGCIPGALAAGKLADMSGRKKVMLLTALLYCVAALGSGLAGSFASLVIYRLVGGVAIGMASTMAPIYISEVAPAKARGRLGMMQQLAVVSGILLSFISNYVISEAPFGFLNADNFWRYMLGIALVPSLLFFLLLLLIPESPRWLIYRGKEGQGRKIFSKIYHEAAEADAQVAAVHADHDKHAVANLKTVFSARYKKVVLVGLGVAAATQLTGVNCIFYYAPLIFAKTGTSLNPLFQTVLTGAVNLAFTIMAFWMIDRLGRRRLLLMGTCITALCMLLLALLFWANALDNYFVLGVIFLYIAGFATSWGVVVWVYVAEIFPNHIRGTATSIAVTGNWTANAISVLTFPYMLNALHGGPTFLVYALLNAGLIWFVSRFVFETKGIPLEKMEAAYAV